MTKEFIKNHRLALTPLAPIHLGLGEEFEPTEYIIDPEEKLLYAFDPSQASSLPGGPRQELLKLAEAGRPESIHQIYKLIRENKEHFLPLAHSVIPVSSGVAQKYQESLGRPVRTEGDLGRIFNSNYIERAITSADGRPFIPGSGVKGAIRTAWLEALYQENPGLAGPLPPPSDNPKDRAWETFEKDFPQNILKGDFQTSPFRLLKIADFMPAPARSVDRKIVFACNYIKVNGLYIMATRKEVILPGQYRLFQADLTLLEPKEPGLKDQTPPWQPEIKDMARHCREYYRPRLDKELKLIRELGLVNQAWADRLSDLLAALQNDFDSGRAFLLRLGRHGDAGTKTVADIKTKAAAELPRIYIRGSKNKGIPDRFDKETTTIWLAAEREKADRDLLPFGWALVEIDPDPENAPLNAFCQAESRGRPDLGGLISKLAEKKARLKEAEAARKTALEAEQAREKARKEAEAAAREAERKALAALPPEQARLEEFRRRLEIMKPLSHKDVSAANNILTEAQAFLETAQAWPEPERQKCAEVLAPLFEAKNILVGKREKRLKELLRNLRGQGNG